MQDIAVGIYIDGSYVTRKLAPRDVDVLIVLPRDFDWDSEERSGKLAALEAQCETKCLHVFFGVEGVNVNHMRELIRFWTQDRNHEPKGIVYVELRG